MIGALVTSRAGLVLACMCIAAGAAQGGAPGPVFTNATYRFSVAAPDGWVIKQHRDAIVVFMVPQSEQEAPRKVNETTAEFVKRLEAQARRPALAAGFRANIAVTLVTPPTRYTLAEYARMTRNRSASLRGYRIVSQRNTLLGGQPAIERLLRITLADGTTTRNREVFCMLNGSVFTLALASAPAEFSRRSAEFDKSISSFRWTK